MSYSIDCGCPRKITAAAGDGHRPALSAETIIAGVRYCPSPPGIRRLFNRCCCVVILRPRGQFWAVAGQVTYHCRQRPLTAHIYRGDNQRHESMVSFAVRIKGGLHIRIERVIVDVLAVGIVSTTGQGTVEMNLDFRGSSNKRPTKRGCHQKQNRCRNTTLHWNGALLLLLQGIRSFVFVKHFYFLKLGNSIRRNTRGGLIMRACRQCVSLVLNRGTRPSS